MTRTRGAGATLASREVALWPGFASPAAVAPPPATAASSPAPASPPPAAPPGGPPPGRHAATRRGWHQAIAARAARATRARTTPAIVRAAAAAAIAAAALLATVIAVASSGVAGGLSAMGGTDAPEVSAATGLYFSLSDMDAQVANMLLATASPALAASRPRYLAVYARDRAAAAADLQQAAVTAAGNPAAEGQLRVVLDDAGQYEALAASALLATGAPRASGPAATGPGTAVGYYRQATTLMRAAILPRVAAVGGVSSARLDGAYAAGRSAASGGRDAALAAGAALAAVLAGLQVLLARRFRRRVSPALAAATVVAVALAATTAGRLGAESGHLVVARQDAFGSIAALSQARAVSYQANADESRYLADPGRAAQYQASFLAGSQQLASVGAVPLSGYEPALAAAFSAWQSGGGVRFGGYLGAEFRNITFPGERAAAIATMRAYLAYQQDDARLRRLAAASPTAAAELDTGTSPGQSDWAFSRYDQALSALIAINQRAFTAAVAAGRAGAAGWDGAVPAGGAVVIAALVLAGVRPRLAEYR